MENLIKKEEVIETLLFTAEKSKRSIVTKKLDGPIGEPEAKDMVDTYRSKVEDGQTKVIIHDPVGLADFMNNIFAFHTAKFPPPAGYSWKLGFTFMAFSSGPLDKVTMAIIPTLVENAKPANVKDYWISKAANDTFYTGYYKPLLDEIIASGFKSFIFDEGNLWP